MQLYLETSNNVDVSPANTQPRVISLTPVSQSVSLPAVSAPVSASLLPALTPLCLLLLPCCRRHGPRHHKESTAQHRDCDTLPLDPHQAYQVPG